MQWWCVHAHVFDQDGRRFDVYVWPALGSLDEAWITSIHTEDEVLDLTTLHLPVGSLSTAREGVDVSWGANRVRGSYPKYRVEVSGEPGGEPVSCELDLEAVMPAFEAIPTLRGITWHYVPRLTARATITRGSEVIEARGEGYIERRRGRFWAPTIRAGLWESIPALSDADVTIPLMYKVWKRDGGVQLQTLTFSDDGRTMVDMPDVEIEFLEKRRYEGFDEVEHPARFAIRAEGPNGSADLVVTRSPHRLKMRNYFADPDPASTFIGMYGTGQTQGTLTVNGTTFDVDAPSYGSALFFGQNGVFPA
jgi:hypothetical protein